MFDIGWDEMALIAAVSLIVIGPKDLPAVLRQVGRWTSKARSLAGEFQRGVDDMVRESELSELRQQVAKVSDIGSLQREVEKTIDPDGQMSKALEVPSLDQLDAPPPPSPAPDQPAPVAGKLPEL